MNKPGILNIETRLYFFAGDEEKHRFAKWKNIRKKGKIISIYFEILLTELICISPNIIDL